MEKWHSITDEIAHGAVMADELRCDYTVPGEISDEDAFSFMVDAFSSGIIGPFERLPVLRLFTGQVELVFVVGDGGGGDETMTSLASRATTIRLSPAVQLQLVSHFSHLLAAN